MRFSDLPLDSDIPKGVRDFLPLKAAKLEYLQKQLRKVYSAWGFRPVIPPQLEFLDVLERGLGEGLRDRAFRFDDRQSNRLLAFPPDMTAQVARIAATRMSQMLLPLRLCYNGRVLRHTEQQAGKDRDIFQSGVELIGLDGPEADAEMIAMTIEALGAVGASGFSVDIGQMEFFRGVMDGLPFDHYKAERVADAILRKDSSELDLLLEDSVISDRSRAEILALPRLFGGREVLERAEKSVTNDRSRRALDNLADILDVLETYGVSDHVTIDLGELRGLNYHTGITFQGFLPGLGRSICSGGRYNTLMAKYGLDVPATGFTFSLLHLLFALDKDLDETVVPSSDLLVYSTGGNLRAAQKLARLLRERGYTVARDIIKRQTDETLVYARQMNYRYMAIVTAEEQEIELVCLADESKSRINWQQVQHPDFTLN